MHADLSSGYTTAIIKKAGFLSVKQSNSKNSFNSREHVLVHTGNKAYF